MEIAPSCAPWPIAIPQPFSVPLSSGPLGGKYHIGRVSGEDKNAFIPVERILSMNTFSWISTIPRGSERSEWASPWMERASEVSVAKQSAAEWVSGVSGASERM